jgi:Nif-specific regulatory protein
MTIESHGASLDAHNSAERFELQTRIATGNLFESFVGFDRRLKRKVLVKRPAKDSSMSQDACGHILKRSFESACHFRHPNILSPISGFEQDGKYNVVYPYVAESVDLNTEMFRRNYQELLFQIFSAVDFIHCMGYVHCDLKKDNFRILRHGETDRVLLSDFDLLTASGMQPEGLVFGSPLHIAPEILRNEIVLPQSDHYSLGVMLLLMTHSNPSELEVQLGKVADGSHQELEVNRDTLSRQMEGLVSVVNSLSRYHHVERPANLGHLLREYGSQLGIDASRYENHLLWHVLRTRYYTWQKEEDKSRKGLQEFLTHDVKLLGIPQELATDLEGTSFMSHSDSYRVARKAVSENPVERYVDHFYVSPSLGDLEKLYARVDGATTPYTTSPSAMSWVQVVRTVLKLKAKGQFLKAAILLKRLLRSDSDEISVRTRASLYVRLGECCRHLGFVADARQDFTRALASNQLSPTKQVHVHLQQADLLAIDKNQEEHDRFLHKAYAIATAHDLLHLRLKVLERQLWTVYQKGRPRPALRDLRVLARIAKDHRLITHELVIQNVFGCIEWTLGNLDTAQEVFQTAIRNCAEYVDSGRLVPLYANLGMVSFDRGEYKEAIEFNSLAKKLNCASSGISRGAFIEASLFSCYVLIGEYEKAERSMANYLEVFRARGDRGAIGLYHLNMGWLNLRRGRYREAEFGLRYATAVFESVSAPWYLGKALLYLGTLYCWQGKVDLAVSLQSRAEKIFQEMQDRVFLLDSRQLRECLEFVRERKVCQESCVALTKEYVGCGNSFGACSCIALLLFSGDSEEVKSIVAESEPLRKYLSESAAVFVQAVYSHIRAFYSTEGSSAQVDISRLKESFRRYSHEGLYFHALHSSLRIQKHYEATEQAGLRLRFLREALRLAKLVSNPNIANEIEISLGHLTTSADSCRPKYVAFHHVSALLNTVSDYKSTAQQLLRLALDETSAERGAILLTTEGGKNLRVEAAIDCDHESLSDIINLSKNVIQSVYDRRRGMFVEDALQDETTKSYKSVVVHNILSIACVPLISQDRLIGVLYLDHHSLPGLFGIDERELIQSVANFIAVAFAHARTLDLLQRQKQEVVKTLATHGSGTMFITRNREMKDILEKLPIIANSDAAILLRGESGTGKEILATMIHQYSPYRDGPLVSVNCAALDGELLESELFGIERGVATGVARREGRLHTADGGTLFLDEIGDMPIATQAKLLRVIETKQFEMVGSNVQETVDIRVVAATNKELGKLISNHRFRSDLYYRINTIEIFLPPLRDRPEDVELLIEHFASILAPNRALRFSGPAMETLTAYSWPGNVRELRNVVEKMCILHQSGIIDIEMLPTEIAGLKARESARTIFRGKSSQSEKARITELLNEFDWNQSAVARALNLSHTTLQRRIKQYGIERDSRNE